MTTRRTFLRQMGAAAAVGRGRGAWRWRWRSDFRQAPAVQRVAAGKATDVKIDEVTFAYEEHRYRTPLKFGGTLTDRVTILNVHCVVSAKNGKSARGFGSMPMGNVWSWPSRVLSYDQTLDAMKALAGRVRDITAAHKPYGHPIDLMWTLEDQYLAAAARPHAHAGAGRADSQAVHADRGQPVRRGGARRVRQAARRQLLRRPTAASS